MRETIHVASVTQHANHALSGNSLRTLKTGFDRSPCRCSAKTSSPGKMNPIATQVSSRLRSARPQDRGRLKSGALGGFEPAGAVAPVVGDSLRSESFSSDKSAPPLSRKDRRGNALQALTHALDYRTTK